MPTKLYTVGGNIATLYNGNKAVWHYDPYNPLDLPDKTIRLKLSNRHAAPSLRFTDYTLIDAENGIWDCYVNSDNWNYRLYWDDGIGDYVEEILGANTTSITSMKAMSFANRALSAVAIFDTSNVTNMRQMFNRCTSLPIIPELNTSKVTDISYMFLDCYSLTSNATDFITSHSHIANHHGCFANCSSMVDYAQASAQYPDWFDSTYYPEN